MAMVSEETVRTSVWPVAEALIAATLEEDDASIQSLLVPGSEAAILHHLFGFVVFDLLLKTVLGRNQLAVTRAIKTEQGKYVHVEFVWPDPDTGEANYTAADLVSVQFGRYKADWRVVAVNPAATDLPLTEARAQDVLLAVQRAEGGQLPQEPWVLPVALVAGSLPLQLRDEALAEPVQALLLPGMQERRYGILSLVGACRLWQEFKQAAGPDIKKLAPWAAAVEFIMSEQGLREQTQAAAGKPYGVGLAAMLPRIRQIKETLAITGLDARYSILSRRQIVLKETADGA
jgi:hypothetical protein